MHNIEKLEFDAVDGIECRILITNNEPFVCVTDLYKQLDVDKSTISRLFSRNEQEFNGYIIKVNGNELQNANVNPVANNATGFQRGTIYNFINENGYNLLIQKINPDTIRNMEAREKIINHQRGMAEVFTKYRRKELVSTISVTPVIHPSMRSPEQVCKDKIDLGVYIADIVNVPKTMMIAVALAEATRETGVSFEKYQKCLPPAENEYEGAHISARDLGKPYGDNGSKTNKLLHRLGYVTKENSAWKLTKFGEDFGGAYFHYTSEKSGHSGIYIQWPAKMRDVIENNKIFFSK